MTWAGGAVFIAGACALSEIYIGKSSAQTKHPITPSARQHDESVRGKRDAIVDEFFILDVRAGTGVITRAGDDDFYALDV